MTRTAFAELTVYPLNSTFGKTRKHWFETYEQAEAFGQWMLTNEENRGFSAYVTVVDTNTRECAQYCCGKGYNQ